MRVYEPQEHGRLIVETGSGPSWNDGNIPTDDDKPKGATT